MRRAPAAGGASGGGGAGGTRGSLAARRDSRVSRERSSRAEGSGGRSRKGSALPKGRALRAKGERTPVMVAPGGPLSERGSGSIRVASSRDGAAGRTGKSIITVPSFSAAARPRDSSSSGSAGAVKGSASPVNGDRMATVWRGGSSSSSSSWILGMLWKGSTGGGVEGRPFATGSSSCILSARRLAAPRRATVEPSEPWPGAAAGRSIAARNAGDGAAWKGSVLPARAAATSVPASSPSSGSGSAILGIAAHGDATGGAGGGGGGATGGGARPAGARRGARVARRSPRAGSGRPAGERRRCSCGSACP